MNLLPFIFMLLLPLFEYGSYRIAVAFIFFSFLISLFRGKINFNRSVAASFFLIIATLFFAWTNYIPGVSDLGRTLSFLVWPLSFMFLLLHYPLTSFFEAARWVFRVLIFFAFLDFLLFFLLGVDFTSFLGVESRHVTLTKPYVRSTGLFGEPGTQAIALLFLFSLIPRKKPIEIILYLFSVCIVLSPYLLLGLLLLLRYFGNRKFLQLFFVFTLIALFVYAWFAELRLFRILTLQDSSMIARVEAVYELFSGEIGNGMFSDDVLLTDAGLVFDIVYQFGFEALILALPFLLSSNVVVLFLKVKIYSGWFSLFFVSSLRKRK